MQIQTEHANITMKNLQIQVGVTETIILFIIYSLFNLNVLIN